MTFAAKTLCGLLAWAPAALGQGSSHAVSFLACPLARDEGPAADLCFVVDHDGEPIALSNPPDFGMPQLQHQVLVEGRVSAEPGSCGGRKFEGRISVMREIDWTCDTVLPFDGSFQGVAGGVFNNGSPEQRADAARLENHPQASLEPAILDPPAAPMPRPPCEPETLTLFYPFGSTRASGPDVVKLTGSPTTRARPRPAG